MKVGGLNYTGFAYLAGLIIDSGAKKATQYISPTEVAKATRRGKARKSDRTVEMVFTIGKPNFEEREFIKKCKKAGEPFPVKKIQVKFYNKSR
jgi:hypothetical protein